MSRCLGDVAAALVDGELDHAARERAQRHLAHCAACRAEVDAQRRLKARLGALAGPEASDALTARLRALQEPVPSEALTARLRTLKDPVPSEALTARLRAAPAAPVRPVSVRPTPRAAGAAPPSGRPRRAASLRRRAAAGSAVAALGVVAALALGAPPQRPASTPVDPGTEAFVSEFVSTSNDGAGPATAVSVTGASTVGGARSGR